MMKLSIITINYNNYEGLKKTINSVVEQTYQDFEWIVIDGGSTDGSKELIEQYTEHFSYWVSEPDKGIYNAMNKGIQQAKGEWLQFLNSGDWLYSNDILETIFSQEWEADILYGNVAIGYSINNDEKKYYIKKYPPQVSLDYFFKECINHQSGFYKRELFDDHIFSESLAIISDWKLHIEFCMIGKRYHYIDLIIAGYEGDGISSNEIMVKQELSSVIASFSPFLQQQIKIEHYFLILQKHPICRRIISFSLSLVDFISHLFDINDYIKKKYFQ